jgi:hypothetical protein
MRAKSASGLYVRHAESEVVSGLIRDYLDTML